jgi:hypothetical protein
LSGSAWRAALASLLLLGVAALAVAADDPTPTQAQLAVSAETSKAGDAVSFTVTIGVQTPGELPPSGRVDFFEDGLLLGSADLAFVDSDLKAVLTLSGLPKGRHEITARYLGDGRYGPSQSPAVAHTVEEE